jgi:hypothetical protein
MIAAVKTTMNRLALNRGYLCGAMDRVLDGGIGWRQDLMQSLKDLKIHWLDPTRKPIDIGVEDLENRGLRHQAKRAGDFEFVRNQMKQIRPVDLRMVDVSDFLIVNLDLQIHATGTYEELYLANRQKKPVLIRVEQGIEHTPDWLFGTVPFEMIFSTWDQVKTYLRHIAHDPVIDRLNRWYFFNFTGENCIGRGNRNTAAKRTARRKKK